MVQLHSKEPDRASEFARWKLRDLRDRLVLLGFNNVAELLQDVKVYLKVVGLESRCVNLQHEGLEALVWRVLGVKRHKVLCEVALHSLEVDIAGDI